MEGTQPATPLAPASKPHRRARWTFAVLGVAVIIAASVSVYILIRRPSTPLIVLDGSTSHVLEATFFDYQDTGHPIYSVYTATTFANESDGATSTVTLRLYLGAFDDPYMGAMFDLFPVVSGSFEPDLSPTSLTLTFNQTGQSAWAWGYSYTTAFNNSLAEAPVAFSGPTNVTANRASLPQVSRTGSTSMSTNFLNQSSGGPRYEFLWPAYIEEVDPLGDNVVFGVRATVTGPFTPSVSVGILIHTVNIPVTFSTSFWATIERSADRTRWNLNVISGAGNLNASILLRVLTLDGATVVPATPLGDLYRSPFNDSIAYIPATPGAGVISIGDLITLSAALYSYDYLVQILGGSGVLFQATLG